MFGNPRASRDEPMRLPWRSAARNPGPRVHSAVRMLWVTAAGVVAFLALTTGLSHVSASYWVCASCHEMRADVMSWRTSPHARVTCPDCHQTPRPWYAFPETFAERAGMLKRDIDAHNSARAQDASSTTAETIPDSNCLRCHDLSRVVTVRDGTLINHNEHAKRNKSCLTCHMAVAHREAGDESLQLMDRCFTCHGRGRAAKAPGTCDVCHPKSFKLRPRSHDGSWRARHGKIAKADRQQCAMCHENNFCGDCHRLEMPHPSGWIDGRSGHSVVGRKDWQVCTQCHGAGADLCDRCHHKDYDAAKGPWVAQHPPVVGRRGSPFCMQCHVPAYCSFCHTSNSMK